VSASGKQVPVRAAQEEEEQHTCNLSLSWHCPFLSLPTSPEPNFPRGRTISLCTTRTKPLRSSQLNVRPSRFILHLVCSQHAHGEVCGFGGWRKIKQRARWLRSPRFPSLWHTGFVQSRRSGGKRQALICSEPLTTAPTQGCGRQASRLGTVPARVQGQTHPSWGLWLHFPWACRHLPQRKPIRLANLRAGPGSVRHQLIPKLHSLEGSLLRSRDPSGQRPRRAWPHQMPADHLDLC